jgi:hypothetical protein
MITSSKAIQKKRRVTGDWDRVEITKNNFWNSNVYLDSIGIPRNAKILVIDAYTTNIPLILMNRMGYTVLKTSEDEIKKSLTWNYDYIVIQNCFLLSDVVKNYPDIINCLEKINGNGKITIFKHLKSFQKTNLLEFLGLDKQKPCWTNSINFDTISASCWRNTNATKDIYYSKPSSGILSEKDEYGLTFSLKDSKEISEQEHQMMFQAKVFTKKHIIDCTCKIVVSVNCNNENVLYQSYDLNTLFKNSNQWNDIQLLLTIPKTNTSENELSVYFWNPNKSSICYDDIRLDLY